MTLRALLVSLMLVLLICGFGYYSHHVANLPSMVSGSMPLLVFSTLVVLAVVVNPLLRRASPGARFSGPELAVIVALGASVCGYTGATFLRYLGSSVTVPMHVARTQPTWQATEVLSYVPGHVGRVAPGHLRDPVALARRVAGAADADDGGDAVVQRLWAVADETDRRAWRAVSEAEHDADHAARVATLVNRGLAHRSFLDAPELNEADRIAAGRRWLQQALPELFVRPPPGAGVLLNDGQYEPAIVDGLLFGSETASAPVLGAVDWSAWWPVIRLWGGLMALLVLTVICLSVIVRRQWADHERLAFPLVRFAELMIHREAGQRLPSVAHARLFWVGFASVTAVHLLNGLHEWFPRLPEIPLQLEFSPLRELFPHAARAWQASGIFEPTLYPIVIAFAFMLPRTISLSFGLTTFVYVALAAYLMAYGIGTGDDLTSAPFHELLNFGAMLGMCAAMLYTGRRYYAQVALHALLPAHRGTTPPAERWAFRGLIVLVPLSVYHLAGSGLSPMLAALAVGVVLLLWLVTARIVCETGLFRVGSSIVPVGIITALFGFEGVGPSNLIVLAMVGVLLATDLWETPMAYTITGMQLTRRTGLSTRTAAPAIAFTALAGLALALVATLVVQHHFGVVGRLADIESIRSTLGLDLAARAAGELAAAGRLTEAVEAGDWQRLAAFRFDAWSLGWIGAGLALFALVAAARLRLPWWPIHPVLFVLLGNWGLVTFGFSFLLGWAVKASVIRVSGARGFHRLLPLMAGVIGASLFSGLLWLIVGLAYFMATGQMPASYGPF